MQVTRDISSITAVKYDVVISLMKLKKNIHERKGRGSGQQGQIVPYGGWRSSFKVHWFKDQVCRRRQLNNLSTHEA